MKILIALDSFKDSMTAREACSAAAEVLREHFGKNSVIELPISDEGEGFCELMTNQYGGDIKTHYVLGPRLTEQAARYGVVDINKVPKEVVNRLNLSSFKRIGMVEMAQASGLEWILKEERNPWKTSTYGVGQLLQAVSQENVAAIFIGMDGSATTDVGLGALQALGLEIQDKEGLSIKQIIPNHWIEGFALKGQLKELPPLFIVCDVEIPLIGEKGAIARYGPQKGLVSEEISKMELTYSSIVISLSRFFTTNKDLNSVVKFKKVC